MELVLNLIWALLAVTGLVYWSLKHWRIKDAFALRLLALAVLLCILFPTVSISDDLWSLHNPAETDILQRRNDSVAHTAAPHKDIHPLGLAPFLAASFALPAHSFLGQSTAPRWEHPLHEAPGPHSFTIRPPPVL